MPIKSTSVKASLRMYNAHKHARIVKTEAVLSISLMEITCKYVVKVASQTFITSYRKLRHISPQCIVLQVHNVI